MIRLYVWYPLVNKLVDPENHQFFMETSRPTPMTARVYVNLPEGRFRIIVDLWQLGWFVGIRSENIIYRNCTICLIHDGCLMILGFSFWWLHISMKISPSAVPPGKAQGLLSFEALDLSRLQPGRLTLWMSGGSPPNSAGFRYQPPLVIPSGYVKIAIEHGHRNSEFSGNLTVCNWTWP